jgi:uncharacterized protein
METTRKVLTSRIAFGIFVLILIIFVTVSFVKKDKPAQITKVCYQNNCFNVEIADTAKKQSLGLMNRTSLDKNRGMLFVFKEEGNYSFWMKDTLIPLDMIWINSDYEVVYLKNDVQPCKTDICQAVSPDESARYVLEVNSGTAQKIGIKIGSFVTIK